MTIKLKLITKEVIVHNNVLNFKRSGDVYSIQADSNTLILYTVSNVIQLQEIVTGV